MIKRLLIPIFLVFICASLMAQPEIVSITYGANEAILTRNTPPVGIVYYWQGSTCGVLMNHSGSTTIVSNSGTFFLKEYYSTGTAWATSCASTIVMFADVTAPVLSDVTVGPIYSGDDILATSNEDGTIYLVPDGTASDLGAITTAQVSMIAATANVASTLVTTGIAQGDYVAYAVDGSDNISAPSPVISVSFATSIDPNNANSDQVQLYPSNVTDILYIKSKVEVSSALVYSLQGAQLINITTPTDRIDMSGLASGVYIVKVKLLDKTIYSGKVTKK
jgi:hypothetical protein